MEDPQLDCYNYAPGHKEDASQDKGMEKVIGVVSDMEGAVGLYRKI